MPDDLDAVPPLPSFEVLTRLNKEGLTSLTNRYLKLSEKATDHAFFPLRAQIFMQELARRTQNGQSLIMIGCTIVILIATLFIAWATFLPPTLHADNQRLLEVTLAKAEVEGAAQHARAEAAEARASELRNVIEALRIEAAAGKGRTDAAR